MSCTQRERDQFIAEATRAGIGVHHARQLLRKAATAQRLAEAQCNGDWPYANGGGGNQYNGWVGRKGADCPRCGDNWAVDTVKKNGCPDCRNQDQIRALLVGSGFRAVFQGDPRGCVVRIFREATAEAEIESGRERGIGVPA